MKPNYIETNDDCCEVCHERVPLLVDEKGIYLDGTTAPSGVWTCGDCCRKNDVIMFCKEGGTCHFPYGEDCCVGYQDIGEEYCTWQKCK